MCSGFENNFQELLELTEGCRNVTSLLYTRHSSTKAREEN
jgi:hypothetical protein